MANMPTITTGMSASSTGAVAQGLRQPVGRMCQSKAAAAAKYDGTRNRYHRIFLHRSTGEARIFDAQGAEPYLVNSELITAAAPRPRNTRMIGG
jgi:hypothetical protein